MIGDSPAKVARNGQIIPYIGSRLVQKLTTLDVETWHATLRASGRSRGDGGVSPRTVVHAHRTLSHALDDAVRHGAVPRNVAKLQAPPKVQVGERAILDPDGIAKLIPDLRGHLMYPTAMVALITGMRLGEILALRWLNADAKLIRVREALEETNAHGLRFKSAKSKAGRRDIGMPEIVVDALRDHRRQQLELRNGPRCREPPADALVCPDLESGRQAPCNVSRAWRSVAAALGTPEGTLHGLRRTHASQLIEAGVDIVTISKRLGHANPDVT